MGIIYAGQFVDSALFNREPVAYVPVLSASTTPPTLGSGGTISGWYYRIGTLVVAEARFRFGTSGTNAGSGTYTVTLPPAVPDPAFYSAGGFGIADSMGVATARDNSAPGSSTMGVSLISSVAANDVAILTELGIVTNTTPWAWTVSDGMAFQFLYHTLDDS